MKVKDIDVEKYDGGMPRMSRAFQNHLMCDADSAAKPGSNVCWY